MKMNEKKTAVKKFWQENTRGGVTVFICLILIPVLMFTGLMSDLARIKLYHSETAGVADSYADAVLSEYNELLFDVYGLISITQDKEALEALDVISEYMASAYDPKKTGSVVNASKSSLEYIPNNYDFFADEEKIKSSWSPYGNSEMTLKYAVDKSSGVGGANLSNPAVFANQVCDYTKIIGPVDLTVNGIMSTLDESKTAKQNEELLNLRKKTDDKYKALDGNLGLLYIFLEGANSFDIEEFLSEPAGFSMYYGSGTVTFNSIYDEFVKLGGGILSDGLTQYDKIASYDGHSVLNELFEDILSDRDQYEEWKSDFDANKLDPSNPLVKISRIKEALLAENAEEVYNIETKYGKEYSKYAFKAELEFYKTLVDNKYNGWVEQCNDGNDKIRDYFIRIKELLSGSGSIIGGGVNINEIAQGAESGRQALIDKCNEYSENDMAKGMKGEYDFDNPDSEAAPEEQEQQKQLNGELKFISRFDYDWLGEKYDGNIKLLQYTIDALDSDKKKVIDRAEKLEGKVDDLVGYIDERLKAVEQERDDSKWDWSYHPDGLNLKYTSYTDYIYPITTIQGTGQEALEDIKNWVQTEYNGASCPDWFKIYDNMASKEPENRDYSKLWDILTAWYQSGGNSEKGKKKEDSYKDLYKKIKELIGDDTGKEVVDAFKDVKIPDFINASSADDVDETSITSLFNDDGDFTQNIKEETIERLSSYYITKLLMMDYDYNFFSNATFSMNYEKKDEPLAPETLKGEKITKDTNYLVREAVDNKNLVGAELEYIYWGSRDAQKNIKAVRNQIMIIRGVENYASTYSIDEINKSIKAIRKALLGISRIAALIVPPLIRAAVAMAETYTDMQILYAGGRIAVYKTKLAHMSIKKRAEDDPDLKKAIDNIFSTSESEGGSPLNKESSSGNSNEDETVEFNYQQYVVLCIMLFCDTGTIVSRTQDIVELNMNHRQGVKVGEISDKKDLKFRLSDASVVISAECTVKNMNLLILGGVFNNSAVDDYLVSDDLKLLSDGFSYTVVRSY